MNSLKRNTRKYNFARLDLARLKELGSLVVKTEDFQKQYGKILNLLQVRMEEGCLQTLVQFYDPLYHCFTFPDYQLVPTLEEYAYLIGLSILDQVPFHGLEPIPTPLDIANTLHIEASLVKDNLITKSGLLGLHTKFLLQQAVTSAEAHNNDTFYPVLALLLYGLILFPNPDHFIDIHTIQIFLTRNPFPTLLADTYHYIHDRTSNGRGAILCCAPLLYRWFTSHLPQTQSFLARTRNLPWSEKIMSLPPSDIVWCSMVQEVTVHYF